MKTMLPLRLAVLGAVALFTQTTFAQTWQTVDDYQYVAGQGAMNQGLVVAPSGIVYASGSANDGFANSNPFNHGLVMASADGGNTWSAPLDDFFTPGYATRDDGGIVADPAGNLYVAGIYYNSSLNHQFVRRSTDGGLTWQTVDDVSINVPMSFLSAGRITADNSGNVYVIVGRGWTIRKGIGGINYSTVDTTSSPQAWAVFAHATAGVFAVGQGTITITSKNNVSFSTAWLVRRSLDGGATWATVDAYQASSGYKAIALGVGADAQGNLYVVGYADVPNKSSYLNHWQVRKSSDNGASWTTVDDYAPSGGGEALGFAADSNGNLYVAGAARANTGTGYSWTVRERVGGIGAWTTVDNVTNPAGPHAIAADYVGNVFVGGQSGAGHWIVRKN